MVAKDIMAKDVITVSPGTSVKSLAQMIIKNQISGAPVVDAKGKIVGVVSEADIITKKGKQVKAIMNKRVITVTEDTPLEKIAALMTTHRIMRVPVMRGEKIEGIVSRADFVGAIALGGHIATNTPVYDLLNLSEDPHAHSHLAFSRVRHGVENLSAPFKSREFCALRLLPIHLKHDSLFFWHGSCSMFLPG
jgi:CBS domain-containing protein